MSDNSNKYNIQGGTSPLFLLFLLFLGLKLCGVIAWSWWWVTAPLWGGFAVLLAFAAVLLVVMLITVSRRRRANKAFRTYH
jgi:Flp pilus assembly protein TadB